MRLLKLPRLNQSGVAHYILPLVVIAAFSAVGYRMLTASHAAEAKCIERSFQQNSSGHCVKDLEQLGNFFAPRITPKVAPTNADGKFGAQTKAIILGIQKTFSLKQDGVVDPKTWNIICAPQTGPGIPDSFPMEAAADAGCAIAAQALTGSCTASASPNPVTDLKTVPKITVTIKNTSLASSGKTFIPGIAITEDGSVGDGVGKGAAQNQLLSAYAPLYRAISLPLDPGKSLTISHAALGPLGQANSKLIYEYTSSVSGLNCKTDTVTYSKPVPQPTTIVTGGTFDYNDTTVTIRHNGQAWKTVSTGVDTKFNVSMTIGDSYTVSGSHNSGCFAYYTPADVTRTITAGGGDMQFGTMALSKVVRVC